MAKHEGRWEHPVKGLELVFRKSNLTRNLFELADVLCKGANDPPTAESCGAEEIANLGPGCRGVARYVLEAKVFQVRRKLLFGGRGEDPMAPAEW